jgi:hypothetical protein
MLTLQADDARAVALVAAIHRGDVETLRRHVRDNPDLAAARVVDGRGVSRTFLHVVADWPGHFPNGSQSVALWWRPGRTSTPASCAQVSMDRQRPLCTGPRAAMISACSMRSWTAAPTSRHRAPFSPEARRCQMPSCLRKGPPHAGSSSVGRGPPSGRLPPWDSWTAFETAARPNCPRSGIRSPTRSGTRVVADSGVRPNTCSTTEPT